MDNAAEPRLRVLLVSRRKDTLDALETVLRKHPGVQLERKLVVNGHVDPLHAVTSPPDALILHLGQTWRAELETLAARPADRRPALIVVGSPVETDAMRLAMQAGARDLLPLPLSAADLLAAVDRIARDLCATAGAGEAAVTAFVNAKGGCGATFLACNVAHALAVSRRRVALLDLDLQFGAIPLYFDLNPKRGLLQALENVEELDDTALSAYLVRSAEGLDILGQTADDALPLASGPTGRLASLLRLVRGSREHVIIDLPRRIDPFANQVIERARYVVLVVQQSVTVLRDATRLLKYLRHDLGVGEERLITVINRFEKSSVISPDDIRRTLGGGEFVLVPNDFRAASECIATGQPLLEQFRGAAITKAVLGLSHRIAGSVPDRPGFLARTFPSLVKPRTS